MIFQKALYALLQKEPFYAHFILNSQVRFNPPNLPTAAVGVKKGIPHFYFNTEFLDKMGVSGATQVIKHEILHLLLFHTDQHKGNKQAWNMAMDCAINQYLDVASFSNEVEPITLASLSKLVGKELEPFKTSQYYYDAIKDFAKKQQQPQATLDDHEYDSSNDGPEDSPAEKAAAIAKVTKEANNSAAGDSPQAAKDLIASSAPAQLPWQQLLRNFVSSSVTNKIRNTTKKINRRFSLPVPGKVKLRTLTLGVCVDSSGSISNADFATFLDEIQAINKLYKNVYLIDADCEVQMVTDLNKNKLERNRYGKGGTAYQPAINKALELKCDAIIYFGDFDVADTPTNPGRPFLWVGTNARTKPPGDFGRVVYLDRK